MAVKRQDIVWSISEKQENGTLGEEKRIGTTFDYVINDKMDGYTLEQFFNHYMNFMQNADFIYYGVEKPTNTHTRIWLDTNNYNSA